MLHILHLVRTLVSPTNPGHVTSACQSSVSQSGLLSLLTRFCAQAVFFNQTKFKIIRKYQFRKVGARLVSMEVLCNFLGILFSKRLFEINSWAHLNNRILLASGIPADVLTETINTLAEVIRGCNQNQQQFLAVSAPSVPPRPAIILLLMSMVNDKQPFSLRCAVLYCFQRYFQY